MTKRSRTRSTEADPAALLRHLPSGVSGDLRWTTTASTTIRFSNNRIRQPHLERATQLSLRIADGKRLATATGSDTSARGLGSLLESANSLARIAPVEPKFPGFHVPSGRAASRIPVSSSTARLSPEEASRFAEEVLGAAEAAAPGARVAGVVHVGEEQLRVLNSAGLDRHSAHTFAYGSVLVERPNEEPPVSGWSEGAHWDAGRMSWTRLGEEAAERMARSSPTAVAPGAYSVVLRGPAVAELLQFLAHLGFSANGEIEGWSCLARQRGKRVAPTSVTLVDDPRSRETIPTGIDSEGTFTRATPLITKGVAGPVVTDLISSGRLGRRLTGHALPPEAPWGDFGPVPSNMILAPGDASEDELVRETRRGLLVTRFHYVRVVDPGRGVITGMTRDGTYVIENGEAVRPARNLRFTESVLTALRGVRLVGKDRRIYSEGGGSVTTPSLAVGSFRFTSATLF